MSIEKLIDLHQQELAKTLAQAHQINERVKELTVILATLAEVKKQNDQQAEPTPTS